MSIKKNFFAPWALGLGATRRAAMLLLVMMLTAATAWATSISTINVGGTDYALYTGFTATAGTKSYANFVDGNTSTQWQVMKKLGENARDFAGGTEDPAYVEFHADAPIIPKGYVLTYDNSVNENWKPTSWALKAKLNENDDWTEIHSSNSSLGNGSRFEIACTNDNNNQYQYFRFEIYDVGSTMKSILNELQIYAQFTYTPVPARAATCTEYGLTNDGYLRSDGKYFSDETGTNELTVGNGLINKIAHNGVHHEASDSNIEYWQCSMCDKFFTDAACTHEVTADEVFKGIFGTLTAGTNGESGYYTLESKTYTLTEDVNTAGYIYVPEGVTATIDLNGHTIDRGLTNAVQNGYVIYVKGALTLTDSGTGGTVKGGMDNDSYNPVSCVKVYSDNGGAAFTLQGGTLIGNTSYQYNCAVMGGNNTSITISGGKITGDARGIYSLGNITVSGGEISGNTFGIESLNYSISVSGNPVITNNTNANVTLYSSLTIAGELTAGANIGITQGIGIPTDNAPVTITSGYGTYNNNVSPSTYFSLDNNGQIQTSPVDYMTVVMGWNEDKTEIAVGTALYTVNFDMNGHGDAVDAVSLLSGYKVAEPTKPTADDWFFVGWFTDDACTSQWNFNNAVTSNMTLHAKWTQTAIHSITLPENMVIVSADQEAVGGKYPVGTNIRFKVKSADYVVDGDVSDGTNALTADGDGIYTVTMGDADITITATVKKAVEPNKTLSGSENYEAQDGNVLTGSTSGTVTIAADAKITLSDVTITGGIVCAGTAEITLVGTNSVTGASQKAGIQIGGSGTTLTIKGNGSLTANGAQYAAGIGLSALMNYDSNVSSGNIVIEGGTITANGGYYGAGIGTGVIKNTNNDNSTSVQFGNVTIKGGTVTATGGDSGDGIGKGYSYPGPAITFGTVTIYDGIDKVDASSIKNSGSIVYKHEENDVTASKSDYFTIIENGNRRIIVQKVTPTIADVPDQTYTGSAITPEPTVIAGSLNLTKGTDYVYSYTNNTNFGTATVRATFQGDYASLGYVEKVFTILPPPVVVNVTGNGTVTYNDKVATNGEVIGVVADKGTDVTLTLAPESGYAVSIEYGYTRYTNSGEMTINGAKLPINGTTATLTVPNDLKDGTYVTMTVSFVSALAGGADEASAVALTDNTVTNFAGGWYKVDSNITFDHTLNLLGDTHLIIDDGKTMTVNTASNRGIDSDYTLFVRGDGALSVTTTADYGIAVCVGNYVQTGATVTASGYIGIRCTDGFIAFNFDNDFTFSGGQLTATGNSRGIRADNNITLSCTNATDFIQASSYRSVYGAVKIADGKALTDGTEASNGMNGYSGTLTNEQITAIGGKTLHRAVTTSYVDASGTLHENVIAIPLDNTMTTLAAGWYVVNSDVDYTGTVTLSGNVKLILGDGKAMTVTNTGTAVNDRAIYGDEKTLHIYGQSQGTGALRATAVGGESAIFLETSHDNAGSLLGIHGGVVSASTECASGVAISVQCATDAGGIVIDGGQVTASGKSYGIFCFSGHFDVIGGQVTATGTNGYGLGICDYGTNPGVLTLGYSKASDFVSTNSIYNYSGDSSAGEVKIADDQTLVDGNGNIWSGTLSNDEIQSIRNQTLRPVTGVALTKDGNNVSATFNGSSETTVSIPVDVNVTSVTYNRAFTEGKPSTVMLPFSLGEGQTLTGGKLYKFSGVTKNETTGKWEATMTETTTLQANTPYLLLPDENLTDGKVTFNLNNSTVTLKTNGGGNRVTADPGSHWTFKGTYKYMKWTTDTSDPDYNSEREAEIGRVYGFAGVAKTGIDLGDFVKAKSGARIRPMTCYLMWNDTPNNTRSMTRGTIDELPSSIVVRLLSNVGPGNQDDDDNQGGTTAIGTLDTETGEIDFGGWYDMSGRKLSAKPTQKGLYIHNGKKVIIK